VAARVLMFQGTGSDVGKSLIVAGLCRLLYKRGLKVAPFKPQNMSNNAAVTEDGGEIGRAQALQARAAGMPPSVHMNPVLLKPQSEVGAQVVVQGKVYGRAIAAEFQKAKPELMPFVLDSFAKLKAEADIVFAEGAGSASEINLRANDIANMGFARAADVPVVLIGDIDRGGVIASLAGTKAVIDAGDAALIKGFLVNKFRGDPELFASGMALIAEATGWEALGLIPFFPDARLLPAEDALALSAERPAKPDARIKIAVPLLPHIANFDDLDPLDAEPAVDLVKVKPGAALPGNANLIILPGSKATIADLARCVTRASTSISLPIFAAAAACSVCAAAIRCSAALSTIQRESRVRRGVPAGSACSTWRPRSRSRSGWRRSKAQASTAPHSQATRCISA